MVLDDAFISPELDLQLHQSNTDSSGDYEKVLLQRSITNTDAALSGMKTDVESVIALEVMTDFIRDKKVDKTTAVLFNVATEGYGNLSTLTNSKPAFGIESIEDNKYLSEQEKQVAMENIVNSTVSIMDKLSRGLQNTMLSMGDLVHSFDRNISSIRKRIGQLEQILSDIENKDDLAYNYVKPEEQFIHLPAERLQERVQLYNPSRQQRLEAEYRAKSNALATPQMSIPIDPNRFLDRERELERKLEKARAKKRELAAKLAKKKEKKKGKAVEEAKKEKKKG